LVHQRAGCAQTRIVNKGPILVHLLLELGQLRFVLLGLAEIALPLQRKSLDLLKDRRGVIDGDSLRMRV
jgi:hypothetical protein